MEGTENGDVRREERREDPGRHPSPTADWAWEAPIRFHHKPISGAKALSLASLVLDLQTETRDLGGGTSNRERTPAVRKRQSTRPRVESATSH